MALQSPVTGMDWAFAQSSGGGVNGSPVTDGTVEKHFKRNGWEIVETTPEKLPSLSNNHRNVAFKLTGNGTINDEVQASDPIAVFFDGDGGTISLGSRFNGGNNLFRFEDRADGAVVRNVTVDNTRDGCGVKLFQSNNGFTARDVTVDGESNGANGTKWACGGAYVTVPNNQEVTLRNVNLPHGASRTNGIPSHYDSIGVILNGTSNGVLRMENCTLGGFPNNGVYASGPRKRGNNGKAIIEDHVGYNSDRNQLRVGNDSVIKNPTLYADTQKNGFDNLRGIWFRYSRGARVEGGSIKTHFSDKGSAIRVDSTAGKTTVNNMDIELRSSDHRSRGVLAREPSVDGNTDITIKNTRFHGNGSPRDVILSKGGRQVHRSGNSINVPNATEDIDIR